MEGHVELTPQSCDNSISSPRNSSKESTKSDKRKYIVWDHFTEIEGCDPKQRKASCNYCGVGYACDLKNNETRNLLNHIHNQCKRNPYRKANPS